MAKATVKRDPRPRSGAGSIWLVDGVPHLAIRGLTDATCCEVVALVSLVDGEAYRVGCGDLYKGATLLEGEVTLRNDDVVEDSN